MDSDKARERISDAADDIAKEEQNDQDSGGYPAADRAERIKETAGD
ncbi:MAG: hypothetical protein M3179_13685 [Actinomycetota bacterium]|nr:hypothetical protein [Actinomycetota bacterium]